LVESSQTLVDAREAPGRQDWVDPPGSGALVLGRYRLLERLGAGGFGVVWRASDELLHRDVAVKRIPLAPGEDGERASREALASARLAHPAIVALYEACAGDDAFYLISELVHGQTLAQLIAARTLTDAHVLQIGVALTGALSHAHSRGVIHRDVKPQNVLVPDADPQGVAKLTDFGGAHVTGEDVLTRTGDVLGTLAYMAPEQSEGRKVGQATDLYSLALVLYEALCGVNPVRGSTPAATVRRIGRPVAPLERARADLPRSLTRSLDRALAPSIADRGTLDELRLALEEALEPQHLPSRRRGFSAARAAISRQPSAEVLERPEIPEWEARPPRRISERRAAPGSKRRADATLQAAVERPHSVERPQSAERAQSGESREPSARRALPRTVWLGCAAAAIVWEAAVGRPGLALFMLAAAFPLLALPRRTAGGWLSGALAPVLGLAGLAGAFPAIAGQARSWRARAAFAALGYWWLTLAGPLLSRHLWLGEPAGMPARAVWERSLDSAATHVLAPALTLGVLLGATLWAAGAIVLPFIVRGRSAALDVVAATVWSAAIVSAAPALDGGLTVAGAHPGPRGAVLGAVFGGLLAVAARALRGPV
jgi:serine/threonine protein kinase